MADNQSVAVEPTAKTTQFEQSLQNAAKAAKAFAAETNASFASLTGTSNVRFGEQAANDIKKASAAAHELGFETASAKRELIVLAHELSQGNFSRFGGSLLVLAEQTGAASLLFSGLGLTALGAAAAVAAFVIPMVKGAEESRRFAEALRLTNNYAGLTEDAFRDLSKTVAQNADTTVGKSKEIVQALIETGQFGPRVIGVAAEAAARYAAVTGQTAEEVVKDFAKIGDGVAKFALDHDRSIHFLTSAQYEYIASLERQGRTEDAEIDTLKKLGDQFDPMQKRVTALGYELHVAAKYWGEFWEKAKSGGTLDTVQDRIKELQRQVDASDRNKASAESTGLFASNVLSDDERSKLTTEINCLQRAQEAQKLSVAQEQLNLSVHKGGIEASVYLDKLHEQQKSTGALGDALALYDRQVQAAAKDGVALSDAQQATDRAFIKTQFTAKVATGNAAALKKEYDTLIAGLIETSNASAISFETGQKATEGDRIRLRVIKELNGSLSGLNARQKENALTLADFVAGGKDFDDQAEARNKLYAESARQLASQISSQEANNRTLAESVEAMGKTADELDQLKVARIEHAIALQQEALAQAVLTDQRPEDIRQLQIYIDLLKQQLGLTQQQASINRVDRNDPLAGAAKALDEYQQQTKQLGTKTFDYVKSDLNSLEDAFAKFFVTGKANWADFFQTIAEQAIKLKVIEPILNGIIDSIGKGNLAGGIADFFTGGSAVSSFGAGATDIAPVAATLASVNSREAAAGLFRDKRRGNSSEQGKAGLTNVTHINVAAGPTRSEVLTAIQLATNATESRINERLRRAGVL